MQVPNGNQILIEEAKSSGCKTDAFCIFLFRIEVMHRADRVLSGLSESTADPPESPPDSPREAFCEEIRRNIGMRPVIAQTSGPIFCGICEFREESRSNNRLGDLQLAWRGWSRREFSTRLDPSRPHSHQPLATKGTSRDTSMQGSKRADRKANVLAGH